MSERALAPWRFVPRMTGPYGERADQRETRVDRFLLAAGAGLKRPFSGAQRRARTVAELVEGAQPFADGLTDEKLRDVASGLRADLLRHGFVPELVARSFALVRTAADRTLGLRHFPVQLIGGHVMLQGMLAEMAAALMSIAM